MPPRSFVHAALLGVLGAAGCALFPSLDGLSPADAGDGDASGDAANDAGCAANVSSDSKNCGACGHDCLSAPCTEGVCAPAQLATAQGDVEELAIDGDELFWTSKSLGRVAKCETSDCSGTTTVLVDGFGTPVDLALDATYVYWSDGTSPGSVARCARAGCGGVATTLATSQGGLDGVAVSSTLVFFDTPIGIGACPLTGCTGSPQVVISGSGPDDIATDATYVFAIVGSTIDRCTLPACGDVTSLFSVPNGAEGVASDGVNVVATAKAAGEIFTCPVQGCAKPTLLVGNQSDPGDVVSDGTAAYWVDENGSTVMECALAGCAGVPLVLADSVGAPNGIAVDSTYVYFADGNTGEIARVPK